MKFQVLRQHLGDRLYPKGSTREMTAKDAEPLVKQGLLRKMDEAPRNKALKAAPKNKSAD